MLGNEKPNGAYNAERLAWQTEFVSSRARFAIYLAQQLCEEADTHIYHSRLMIDWYDYLINERQEITRLSSCPLPLGCCKQHPLKDTQQAQKVEEKPKATQGKMDLGE